MMTNIGMGFLVMVLATLGLTRVEPTQKPMDIVDTAVSAGSFKTLVTALNEAGLVEALKAQGPFTVFAPSDEAFAKLPKGTVEALLKDKQKLTAVLTYHVVEGRLPASEVAERTSIKTLNGHPVAIEIKDGKVMVAGVQVTKADIETTNGVIHVIDHVLLPPSN